MNNSNARIQATCHCGNIQIYVDKLTDTVTSCNCSICSRYAALWAYYKPEAVTVKCHDENSAFYIWGDREVEFHHCTKCGCVTHYVTTELCDERIVALNARMLASDLIKDINVRYADGASAPMQR